MKHLATLQWGDGDHGVEEVVKPNHSSSLNTQAAGVWLVRVRACVEAMIPFINVQK
jgi:hypothetical protein